MSSGRLVVIAGNGLSIACSDEFRLETLSQKLRQELAKPDALGDDGLAIAEGLASYLEGSAPGSKPDFEQLVGAFDSLRRSLDLLKQLQAAGSPLADAIGQGELDAVAEFCERVYRKGTATALELIDSAAINADKKVLKGLLKGIQSSRFGTDVTFATLNYDTLLIQCFFDVYGKDMTADLGCGGETSLSAPVSKVTKVLRVVSHDKVSSSQLATRSTRLLNLHGSVQFWEASSAGGNEHVKIVVGKAEDRLPIHRAYGNSETDDTNPLHRPLVIFGNQRDKSVLANEHPFSVAYKQFKEDLRDATAVLVVGYSFEDEVLNREIYEALRYSPAKTLVVTHGERPTDTKIAETIIELGCEGSGVFRGGVAELLDSAEWASFAQDARS